MLAPESWQHYIDECPPGRKIYRDHDCGGGKTLIVSHNEAGHSAWCFRCGEPGFIKHPEATLAERLEKLALLAEADEAGKAIRGEVTLPHGLEFDSRLWPRHAALWLYKVGIGRAEIKASGIGYCPKMDRVVLPVFNEDGLVYWQARGFTKLRPKYINPEVDKSIVLPRYGTGPVIVLTEDLLSAMKIGRITSTLCLLGTSLQDHHLRYLLSIRLPVVVWLDSDAPGLKAAIKITKILRAAGLPCVSVVTKQDPKLLFEEVIRDELSKACHSWRVSFDNSNLAAVRDGLCSSG